MEPRILRSQLAPAGTEERAGFTLVELLVTLAIMALIAALAVPAFQGAMMGNSLMRGAQMVSDQLALARQLAITRETEVEVRFVSINGAYRGVQLWGVSPTNQTASIPLTRLQTLPDGVAISTNTTFSPLLSGTTPTVGPATATFGAYGSLTYCGFRYQQAGGTDLPYGSTSNFVTLTYARYSSATSLPANYCVVQVDPTNGRVRTYRP